MRIPERISESVYFIFGVLATVFFVIFCLFETNNVTLTLRILFALIAEASFILKLREDWNRNSGSVGLIIWILACAYEVLVCSLQYT